MNFYYHGFWRMDWGLGNPNKTGSLIACLMIGIWAIPLLWRKSFWPVLVIFTALAWCLVQTYSRGGMVSLLAGLGILTAFIARPWPRPRWIGLVASLWILGAFVLYAKAGDRYTQGLFTEDQSIGNRLIIWRHVPEMMACAPWGWGFGKAGDSYNQWFEPIDKPINYLNLINSHFTWMVEGGWAISFFYLFGWFVVFLLCWPLSRSRLKAVPLALWVALFVGACFSHVEECWGLWILPALGLGWAVVERVRAHQWPRPSGYGLSGAVSFGTVTMLILMGHSNMSLSMTLNKGMLKIGNGGDTTLILVDRKVLGSYYGHTFRKFLMKEENPSSNRTYILVESLNASSLPKATDLVVCGQSTALGENPSACLAKGGHLILVNPSFLPEMAQLNDAALGKTSVFFGEYAAIPARSYWSDCPGIKLIQINGASNFIPNWPQEILKPRKA